MAIYGEFEGWPKDFSALDDFTPQRKLMVDWSTRFTDADSLVDIEYPYLPGCQAYPAKIRIDPHGTQIQPDAPTATYEFAAITVDYSSQISARDAVMETLIEYEALSPRTTEDVYWADGSLLQPQSRPYLINAGATLIHKRYKNATVPDAVLNTLGTVNTTTAMAPVLGIWFAPETLRVDSPTVSRSLTTAGFRAYSITQCFRFVNNGGLGWNSAFNAKTGAYAYIYSDTGGSNRIYDYPLGTPIFV